MKRIVLGSASPRRFEILSEYFDVEIIPSVGEELYEHTEPDGIVIELALAKLNNVKDKLASNDIAVTADTIVWMNGKVFGKPADYSEAFGMLSELSGKTHSVYTGYAVYCRGDIITGCEQSDVTFRLLSKNDINDYINTGSPYDKAGGYGIQDGVLVDRYSGDYNNIVGLPTAAIKILREITDDKSPLG